MLTAALALVLVQVLVRGWLVVHRGLYADDLLIASRAAPLPLHSADFLLGQRDGHLMPAGFLLAGLLARLEPLQWWPEAVALVLLPALASLAVLRLLRALLGNRPVLLVPLAVQLFSPLSLGAPGWWAAAVNALPLKIGLAWVAADAVALVRTGRGRYAATGTAAFALSLGFYARAVLVPWVALAVAVLVVRTEGVPPPARRLAGARAARGPPGGRHAAGGAGPFRDGHRGRPPADLPVLQRRYRGPRRRGRPAAAAARPAGPHGDGPDGDGPGGDGPDAVGQGAGRSHRRLRRRVAAQHRRLRPGVVRSPDRGHLATARASLAAAGAAPLPDQAVPEAVMWSPAYPANMASRVFAPLDDRPEFLSWTGDLRVLDDAGRLVPAQVAPAREALPGPQPGCGWPVAGGAGTTTLPFDADVSSWVWTVQLDYTATGTAS